MPTAVDVLIGNPTVVLPLLNSNVQQQLWNNYAMDFLDFRLTGTLTLASYTTNPSKYVESVENFIASLQLTATGKSAGATSDVLCNVDGGFLRLKQRMMEGTDVVRTDVGTSNGTYAFETNLRKYFMDPRSDKSRLTRLFTASLSSLTASFQFRDQTAFVYGGVAGTAVLSGLQLTTQARQYLGLRPPVPSPYVKETQRTGNIVAQTNGYVMDKVPVGQVLRRQYFKGMLGPVPWADPSDAIFGASGKLEGPHVQLQINSNTYPLDAVYNQIRANNKALFSVESMPSGYALYEPARNRKLSASLPLTNVATAQNNIDVNYTAGSINTIQITDEQIIALSAAQFNS
jgi:hypothetical protein